MPHVGSQIAHVILGSHFALRTSVSRLPLSPVSAISKIKFLEQRKRQCDHFDWFRTSSHSSESCKRLPFIMVVSEISHFAGLPEGDKRPSHFAHFYKNFPSRTFALPILLPINLAHSQQSWLQHAEDQLQKVCLCLRQSIYYFALR
jgi:hypothetical protein